MMMKAMIALCGLLTLLLPLFGAHADHRSVSPQELIYWGFQPALPGSFGRLSIAPPLMSQSPRYRKHSLPFPVELRPQDPIGSLIHQLQDQTSPAYYHAGVDLRTEPNAIVKSPVAGQIEAGYYAYNDHFDGRSDKFFLSMRDALQGKGSPPWGDYYFEVAVIDTFGNRFEFHHINPYNLPLTTQVKILSGGMVQAGEIVGFVSDARVEDYGLDYHHTHYNIVDASGEYLNPLLLSTAIADTSPPVLTKVFVTRASGCGSPYPFLDEVVGDTPALVQGLLVIDAVDFISDGIFPRPPTRVKVDFGAGRVFEWNFTRSLEDEHGVRPNITDLYLRTYCDTFGGSPLSTTLKTGTTRFQFFIQVPVPAEVNGLVQIELADAAENITRRTIHLVSTP